ncbi:nitrile hydratase subunit beta [uncultured Roseobacter sp.]|uniref:nitrile hydratase subunit beta n=1 Tax=uncultured Roseobacter sp. TaxID=114847 RepID=UPI00260DCDAC|nr:nitrile hydratase subunit beta [uncultured Roseobacter sp.]
MSRPHDMGGRYGDGPVVPEPESDIFHEEWHKRALAVTLAAGAHGAWNIDVSRHARERLAPTDYARFSYYEKWMAGLADLLVAKALVSVEELAGSDPVPSPKAGTTLKVENVPAVLAKGGPADRPSDIAPKFYAGDAVKTRRLAANILVDGGHTRLPAYAAGATGRILRYHGTHILPDSSAHGLGEAPEPLYAVAFPASELWAHPENPADEVVLDLWQSYLAPA